MIKNAAAATALALFSLSSQASWTYNSSEDKMTGKTQMSATTTSANTLSLDFPYAGKNHGHLTVRQHPRQGLGVVFMIDKGQILCSRATSCNVIVRFDEGTPITFTGSEAASHDTTLVFLNNPQRFINQASKAKRIFVQPTLFRQGSPVLEFYTPTPLEWNKPTTQSVASVKPPVKTARSHMTPDPEAGAICGPETNLSSTGECGVLYAQCYQERQGMSQKTGTQFMTTCRRKGMEAAKKEWDASVGNVHDKWPAPPASLTGGQTP